MKEINLPELGILKEALQGAKLKKLSVPNDIRIPYWPSAIGSAKLNLGMKDYLYLELSAKTGFLHIEKKVHTVLMTIHKNGAFTFLFEEPDAPMHVRSNSISTLDRVRAVLLFHQFREEICEKLASLLKADEVKHNQAVLTIEEAMETFIPYMLADDISTWED